MLTLALKMLARDWRAGELRVLALAIAVAVGSVTSVSFFTDRVWQALTREARQILGADVLLIADHPWPAEISEEMSRRGLRRAASMNFLSMARAGDAALLASVKAVTPGYPLRGRLRVAQGTNVADTETDAVPARGSVWLDERLMASLNLHVGDTLSLGDSRFVVSALLSFEPDRGVSFINIAPRLLMHADDVAATGLIQTGSRVTYQLFGAGEPEPVAAFEAWVKPRLARGERMESLENARPEIRSGLERAQQFLGLTALLAVILSSVAVALGARRYMARHLDGYAVMRCLGAVGKRLFALLAWEFVLLALAASTIGCALGYAAQLLVALWLGQFVAGSLPQPGPMPALQGVAVGMVLLLGFALPPLLQLKNVSALRVLRRDVGAPRRGALAAYALALAAVFVLLWWQAGEAKLAGWVFGGFTLAMALFAIAARGALQLAGRLVRFDHSRRGVSWRYGFANLLRRPGANTIQIVALALALTAILLLAFVRGDLIASWRAKLPPDAPDRFLINIQPDQVGSLKEFLSRNGVTATQAFPIVRARLISINGRAVSVADYQEENARRQIEREFNITYLDEMPTGNQVTGGHWFTAQELVVGAISVEQWIAERFGIRLGDRLEFLVEGKSFAAPVTSLRKLDWDSMRPNFFFIVTPQLLKNYPQSFMASYRAPGGDPGLTPRLAQAYPNLTVIDIGNIMRQLQSMTDQLTRAVQFVFLFALASGVLVLYAALAATQDERVHEAAVMRVLGASRAQVLAAQRAEFAALGLIAGLLAALGAVAIGWVLAARVFHFEYHAGGWIWLAGPALGLACVVANAWLGARAALNHPPIAALREAG